MADTSSTDSTGSTDINSIISQLTAATTGPVPTTAAATVPYDSTYNQAPDTNSLIVAAYNSLKPYYQALLTQNNNDVTLAMNRLEEDYKTGVRYTSQDLTTKTGYATDTLDAGLKQLGVTFPTESGTLVDALNKRGIATTQTAPGQSGKVAGSGMQYDAEGNVISKGAAGGEAGYEMQALSEDQQLRQEALKRTASQTIEQLGIGAQRDLSKEQQTLTRGQQDTTETGWKQAETLSHDQQQEALNMGNEKQAQQDTATGLKIAAAQAKAAGASV
jgi:hypothetical protein